MDIMDSVVAYYLTEEEIQKIELDQRARRLEPNLSDIEAKEMWHLLHEEPEYADEILDSYAKLIRDRRELWLWENAAPTHDNDNNQYFNLVDLY